MTELWGVDMMPGLGALLETTITLYGAHRILARETALFSTWEANLKLSADDIQELQVAAIRLTPLRKKAYVLLHALGKDFCWAEGFYNGIRIAETTADGKHITTPPLEHFTLHEFEDRCEIVGRVISNSEVIASEINTLLKKLNSALQNNTHCTSDASITASGGTDAPGMDGATSEPSSTFDNAARGTDTTKKSVREISQSSLIVDGIVSRLHRVNIQFTRMYEVLDTERKCRQEDTGYEALSTYRDC